jgi:ubiquinone/menaquinone biosynthesis C-methylase UbiE
MNICAGDRVFPGWESTDIAPTDPRVLMADATSLPYADATVDVVMMSHALTNLDRVKNGWRRCFEEVHRVLRPGGCFRIDDAPERWYVTDEQGMPIIEPDFAAYAKPRGWVVRALYMSGFSEVFSVNPATTSIPALLDTFTYSAEERWQLEHGLIGNKSWHVSFTLEAVKAL